MSARDEILSSLRPGSCIPRLLDAYRAEVLAKAIGRLRAIPVDCTALTGPVWYGDGWNSAITCLEEIADYQTPDDEAYPGELERLRILAIQLRVAALRKEDLAEAQRLLVVHAEHEMNAREKATPEATATPDFFQPGHTYTRQHHASTIRFFVRYIDDSPEGIPYRVAFGWKTEDGDVCASPFDSDDMDGWVDVTEAAE